MLGVGLEPMKPERAPDLQPGGFVHSPTLALVAGPGIEPGPPAYETGWGTCPSPATIARNDWWKRGYSNPQPSG